MKKLITFIILALFTLGGLFSIYVVLKKPVQPVPPAPVDCSFSKEAMLQKINSVRTHKLVVDKDITVIAQERTNTIPFELDHHKGFLAMVADYRLKSNLAYTGEILASNHCPSTNQIFSQWRNSPDHWSAIENEDYDVLGIGFNGQSAVVIFGDFR